MKKILTLLDFSDTSINALKFAAELSVRTSAHLLIINIAQKGDDEAEARKMLDFLESELKKASGPGLNSKSSIALGSLVPAMSKIIAEERPDLIVMGTKGASGLKRVLIGSNTVKVIANTKVPVLVIPEKAKFESFLKKGRGRIVLATDLDELENEKAIDILKEIALFIIEPKVRVLSVRPKGTELSVLQKMERDVLLSIFNPELESQRVTVFDSDVISGINFYLDKKSEDAGLVAMIARDTGKIIQKHYTREMASHTDLPLLVLQDTKN